MGAARAGTLGNGARGGQEVGAFGQKRVAALAHRAAELEAAGAAGGIFAQGDMEQSRGGGMFALPAPDAAADLVEIALRPALQGAVEFEYLFGQRGHLPLEHGALFGAPSRAAAEHVALLAFAIGVIDQAGFDAVFHVDPVFLLRQRRLVGAQLALGRADDVKGLALAQEADVGLADHAAVHDPDASAWPKRSSILRTMSSTVATSARLPVKTSKFKGNPSGVQTNPMHTCLQSLRWSREQPRAALVFFWA